MVASWKGFQGKKEDNKNPIQDQPKWWRAGKDIKGKEDDKKFTPGPT